MLGLSLLNDGFEFENGALDGLRALFLYFAPQNLRAIHFALAATGLIALVFGLLFLGGGGLDCHTPLSRTSQCGTVRVFPTTFPYSLSGLTRASYADGV